MLTLAGLAVSVGLVGLMVYGIFRYLADHPLNTARPNPLAESVQQFRLRREWIRIRERN